MRFMPLAPEDEKLIEAAADVLHRNYHPVKRSVAAAVVCASGRIYRGIDIESCGYSPCAEPIAIGAAFTNGEHDSLAIVSVGTQCGTHAAITIAAAEAGAKAIACEKPMATTHGDAFRMVRVCEENGLQLSAMHQRRFGYAYVKAKKLIKSGAIGELTEMEATCSDLFGWGTQV